MEPNQLYRRVQGRLIAGVAVGIAEHLRVRTIAVRLTFLALAFFNGVGLVLYGVFWVLVGRSPRDGYDSEFKYPWRRWQTLGQLLVFCLSAFAIFRLAWRGTLAGEFFLVLSIGTVSIGAALLWRRADLAQRQQWAKLSPRFPGLAIVVDDNRLTATLRWAVGGLLVGVGLIGALAASGELRAIREGLLFGGVVLIGAAIAVGPWLWRLGDSLAIERRERIRSQERAEIAANVHDGVLHTLALIQRHAADAREVTRLARGQERELRNWLYKPQSSPHERIGAALEVVVAEVEDTYAISVNSVIVGDAALDQHTQALVQAAREALVNAAKHAGVETVSLYVEVEPGQVTVFVRDRGIGFDMGLVSDDRHGVRGSILERMRRHGGAVNIRTSPGAGTEVQLSMPLVNLASR